MAKFYGKNKDGVRQSVFEQAKSSLGPASFKAGGRLRTLLEVVAELFYSLKTEDLEGFLDQADYTKASGPHLEQLALRCGIAPRAESKASGLIQALANKAGVLKAGAWIVVADKPELRYKVSQDLSYAVTGTMEIPVEAEFPGSQYNVITGSQLRFSSVNLDLSLEPTNSSFPSQAGRDAESDEMLRRRIAARFDAAFAQDLQKSRIEDAVYSNFPSVDQVKVLRTPRGTGSVDVHIKTGGGLPDSPLLLDISSRLGHLRLIARDLQVLAPRPKSLNIRAVVSNAGDIAGVEKAIKDLVDASLIGQGLAIQDLYKAVEEFDGVEIASPVGNVLVENYELLDLQGLDIQAKN